MYRLLLILTALAFSPNIFAYERIVLLAPSAGDIFTQLGAQDKVVGVTRNNFDFPGALKIGSHIKPNVELIKGLDPDLIIISSNRFFSQQMSQLIDAKTMTYNPATLDEVLEQILKLGKMIDKQKQATQLIANLTQIRAQIQPLKQAPLVVYEVTESPFMIAGKKSIVKSIVEEAGGTLFAPSNRKIAKFNIESVLMSDPDYYIYQVGPMNKNPTPPKQRPNFPMMQSEYLRVDQLSFSRATTESFYHALDLNRRFMLHPD